MNNCNNKNNSSHAKISSYVYIYNNDNAISNNSIYLYASDKSHKSYDRNSGYHIVNTFYKIKLSNEYYLNA